MKKINLKYGISLITDSKFELNLDEAFLFDCVESNIYQVHQDNNVIIIGNEPNLNFEHITKINIENFDNFTFSDTEIYFDYLNKKISNEIFQENSFILANKYKFVDLYASEKNNQIIGFKMIFSEELNV